MGVALRWTLARRSRREDDLLTTAGRVFDGVDELKREAVLLAREQAALQDEVVELLRLLVERAGSVSPAVDAVLLAAEASREVSPPLAG